MVCLVNHGGIRQHDELAWRAERQQFQSKSRKCRNGRVFHFRRVFPSFSEVLAQDGIEVRDVRRRIRFAPIFAGFEVRRARFSIDQERPSNGTTAGLAFAMSICLHGAKTKWNLAAAVFIAGACILRSRTGEVEVQTALSWIVAGAFLSCGAIGRGLARRIDAAPAIISAQTQLPRHTIGILNAFGNA